MAAVRKALDNTYVRITVSFMEQQMRDNLNWPARQVEIPAT